MRKRKPFRPPSIQDMLMAQEARASVSLDGDTQSCDLCLLERTAGPHRCGRREMTEAERMVVEAALDMTHYDEDEADERAWDDVWRVLSKACKALRAERSK